MQNDTHHSKVSDVLRAIVSTNFTPDELRQIQEALDRKLVLTTENVKTRAHAVFDISKPFNPDTATVQEVDARMQEALSKFDGTGRPDLPHELKKYLQSHPGIVLEALKSISVEEESLKTLYRKIYFFCDQLDGFSTFQKYPQLLPIARASAKIVLQHIHSSEDIGARRLEPVVRLASYICTLEFKGRNQRDVDEELFAQMKTLAY
ncbi:hypothetical protein EXS70_03540 [Candidatus Peribacteria bacterium]|nr:hypothetical protein [Candidatus Peribacteria bacterium]